ncbi:MAG: SH3 domain-containing protein [Acetatifactor sp.]|nr:SH3 domain-containing protein [Acetatifactor sp.]
MKKRVIGVLITGIVTALIYQQSVKGLPLVEAAMGMSQTQEQAGEEYGASDLAEQPETESVEEAEIVPDELTAASEEQPSAPETPADQPSAPETPADQPSAPETPADQPSAAVELQDQPVPAAGTVPGQEEEETAVSEGDEQEPESEYANLAIAQVDHYVNVRKEPNTDSEVLGKIYNGAVAQILEVAGENQDWFHVISGSVDGYIKSEFFLYGDAAVEAVDNYVTRYATVIADRLNVRQEQSSDSKRIGYIDHGEKVKVLEMLGDWLLVQYTDDKTGYVAAEYVTVSEEFIYAKSIEEERAEQAARRELEARMAAEEQHTPESTVITTLTPPETTYTTNEELRRSIVDYAMQYLGYPYVHGGRSLAGGTDCSGFTCYIYADFGYSISRTPSGQYSSDGRSIDYSEIQPGDIICYGKSKCTHVGLYIGDGQIIHEANSRKGVVIYNAGYDTILGVKNIID